MTQPILVTGSHRSGTTWVGRMLSQASSLTYVYEPFSIDNPRGISNSLWYPYITAANAEQYREEMKRVIQLRPPVSSFFTEGWGLRDIVGEFQDLFKFISGRLQGRTPLLKDPIALFSTEWLVQEFGVRPVVMIRHPLAFAGSVKKLDWRFPFNDFLRQPVLMEAHLQSFETEIRAFAEEERDVVDQAILLWNLLYTTIETYKIQHDDWLFVRHEDIARAPIEEFSDLYNALGLSFDEDVQDTIRAHSARSNPVDPSNAINTERDSKASLYTWQDRLTQEEAERVRRETAEVARSFYDADFFGERTTDGIS